MTPSALRAYLRQRGEASLIDLTAHFGADAALLEDLIAYWQKKGRILESRPRCDKTCCEKGAVFYRWQEEEARQEHAAAPPSVQPGGKHEQHDA